jgi:hypothetical protein
MKKLLVITSLLAAVFVASAQPSLPADEQVMLERYRVAKAQRAAQQAAYQCQDTNALAKAAALMQAATPARTNASAVRAQLPLKPAK